MWATSADSSTRPTLGEGLVAAFQPFRDRFGSGTGRRNRQDEGLLNQEQADLEVAPGAGRTRGLSHRRRGPDERGQACQGQQGRRTAGLGSRRLDATHGPGRRPRIRRGKPARTGWGWERCKTTPRPWTGSVRSVAIRAWAPRLRPCSRSRDRARRSSCLRKREPDRWRC